MNAPPSLAPDQILVDYITHPITNTQTDDGETPSSDHTGHYRDPLPLSDGPSGRCPYRRNPHCRQRRQPRQPRSSIRLPDQNPGSEWRLLGRDRILDRRHHQILDLLGSRCVGELQRSAVGASTRGGGQPTPNHRIRPWWISRARSCRSSSKREWIPPLSPPTWPREAWRWW